MGNLDQYTLQDKIFRDGMYFAFLAGQKVSQFPNLLIVGGGATQIIARNHPHLLRATTDVDVIPCSYVTRSARNAWAKTASALANAEGYSSSGGIGGTGGEVRFDNAPLFLLHLDCFGRGRQEEQERRNHLECTRGIQHSIRDISVR